MLNDSKVNKAMQQVNDVVQLVVRPIIIYHAHNVTNPCSGILALTCKQYFILRHPYTVLSPCCDWVQPVSSNHWRY